MVLLAPRREIDGAGRQMRRLQVDTIAEDDGLAEREPRLRARLVLRAGRSPKNRSSVQPLENVSTGPSPNLCTKSLCCLGM
jgi:hypothetical protein